MQPLPYTIIKTEEQYGDYCRQLAALLFNTDESRNAAGHIELLTLLIEKYDAEHSSVSEQDPITILKRLLADHKMKAKDLAVLLGVSKGLVSDILNYKRGLSKEVIRKLASHFKLSHEAFNRPYALRVELNSHLRNAKVMNTKKELAAA